MKLVKSVKGIQSLVEEICKISQSKLHCQRLQYEIHFISCSCKIESSERKKIAEKKKKRKQADRGIDFCIEQSKNKIRKGPVIYFVFVIDYFIRDQFTFLAKVNIRVKIFSVCSLHLMENSMFVKHVT